MFSVWAPQEKTHTTPSDQAIRMHGHPPSSTRTVAALLGRPLLVAGRVQDDQRKDVDVPHAVHAGEERRRELDLHVVVPPPLALGHLPHKRRRRRSNKS